MSDQPAVRPARPDELDQIGRLTVRAYVADGLVDPTGAYAAELADASRRARDAELLVAVDLDGTLLGTVTVCTPGSPLSEVSRPGELEFRMLAVDPEVRGRGVGEVLVTAVLRQATEVDARGVVLCS
ncbi:MAG: GNAT family N-acetyltransferase, partial [Pseudonocardiaceae bacterium]